MAISLDTIATRLNANAAAVATAMASGTTTAEVQGLAELIKTLSLRNDIAFSVMKVADQTKIKETKPNKG